MQAEKEIFDIDRRRRRLDIGGTVVAAGVELDQMTSERSIGL